MQTREEAKLNFAVNYNFSVEDLQQGIRLARSINVPIIETQQFSDTELLNKYAELKILAEFLEE